MSRVDLVVEGLEAVVFARALDDREPMRSTASTSARAFV